MNLRRLLRICRSQGVAVIPADTTPDPFDFTDATGVPLGTLVESDTIGITGINQPATVSVVGGEYRIEPESEWRSDAATILNNQAVTVRHTSSPSLETVTTTTLTIGGISATFTSTTVAVDTTPDDFSFTAQTGAEPSTAYDSNTVTISGINSPAPVAAAGGTVSINGGSQVASGTISNGQTLKARLTSSSSYLSPAQMAVSVGGVERTFEVTTKADPSPTPTPTPTPSETIEQPLAGPATHTAVFTVGMTPTQRSSAVNTAITNAYNAMSSDGLPKKVAIPPGELSHLFMTNRIFPQMLSIVPQDYANPPIINGRISSAMTNVVIDGLRIEYTPATFSDTIALWTDCHNFTMSNCVFVSGNGRPITVKGGDGVTFYRIKVVGNGAADNNFMVYLGHNSGTPSTNLRVIECALMNGRGGDGFRICGVQNGYFARNLVENLTKHGTGDHCDAIQFTCDSFNVPNSFECIDHLHWGATGDNRFEGFQGTNQPSTAPNGRVAVTRLKTIGGEVSGMALWGCTAAEITDCELYMIDYGVAGAQGPQIRMRNSVDLKIIGSNKAAGGIVIVNDAAWPAYNLIQDDGVTTTGMTIDAATRDTIVAAWKAANPGVPYA